MIVGEGKHPTKNHLLKLALIGNIKRDKALDIIDQVLEATQKWSDFAAKTGVSKLQTKNIAEALNQINKSFRIK
jgi:serine/threonine-protein kinase HipA